MRIVADTSRCVGAGQCVLTEPAVIGRIAAFATLCDLGRRH